MWEEVNAQSRTDNRYVNVVSDNGILLKTYLLLKTILLRKGESVAQPDVLFNLRDKLLVKLINVCLNNKINSGNDQLQLVYEILHEYKNENLTLNFDRLTWMVNSMSGDGDLTFEMDAPQQASYFAYASTGLRRLVSNLTHVREILARAMHSLGQSGTMLDSLLPPRVKTIKLNGNYRQKVDDLIFKIIREMLATIRRADSPTMDELHQLVEEVKRATVPIYVVRSKSDTTHDQGQGHDHKPPTSSYIHVTRLSASKRPIRTYSNISSYSSKRLKRRSSNVLSYVSSIQSIDVDKPLTKVTKKKQKLSSAGRLHVRLSTARYRQILRGTSQKRTLTHFGRFGQIVR